MRKMVLALSVGLGGASQDLLQAQGAPTVTKFEAAGIPVIFKPVRANDVVAVRLYLRGGSAALTQANAGIEALMLQASTHGTAKYGKDAFASRATETGTNISSEAQLDVSVLAMQGVRQHWNEAWELFTEAALRPTFPAAEVEVVRGQMMDQVSRIPDDPDAYLTFLGDSLLYSGHPYAVLPTGTPASLKAITRDALAAWHKDRMAKDNILIVVVGNVDRADLARKISAAFGALPRSGKSAAAKIPALSGVTNDLYVVKRELPTNYITGVFAAPTLGHPDYAAFRLATDVLSQRLFEEVRTKRNLTYAVSAGLESRMVNRGRLYVTAVDPDTTLRVIFSEVARLQKEPVPAVRLAETANARLTAYLLRQETNMGQAAALGLWEMIGGGWQNYDRFLAQYRRVTPAEVQRVATKYLDTARFAVIGNPAKVSRAVVLSF